jgi:hypothetical protein
MTVTAPHPLHRVGIAAVPVIFTVAFSLLGSRFDYPNILRAPSADILVRFAGSESTLLPLWWSMLASALLFIPVSFGISRQSGASELAGIFGALAGIVQALGLSRWLFIVPALAHQYQDSPATRAQTVQLFEIFHQWLGVGIGEWFGYLFTGLWTLMIVHALWDKARVLAIIGLVSGLGILVGLLEVFNLPAAGTANAIAYLVWSLWLIALAFRR